MMSTSYGSMPQTFPHFQHPSHELLKDNGFVWHVYHKYHAKCLKGRKTVSQVLYFLYEYWQACNTRVLVYIVIVLHLLVIFSIWSIPSLSLTIFLIWHPKKRI